MNSPTCSDNVDTRPLISGRDPWHTLQRYTTARVALGRAGGSARTESLLNFRLSHALARDAVKSPFPVEVLTEALRERGFDPEVLASAAKDQEEYLLRPDLGRRLDPASRTRIEDLRAACGARDLVVIISAGLSAQAAERHAVATVEEVKRHLRAAGWTFFPVLIVPLARVKIQDEIGELLGARYSLILLGERPGLSSPDSLGAYFTRWPKAKCTDADRNCVSNIRVGGLQPLLAGQKIAQLLLASDRLGVSGVGLKDSSFPALAPPPL